MSRWVIQRRQVSDGMQSGDMLRRASRLLSFETAAFLLVLFAIFSSYWVSVRYFESLPHIEDEIAYVWQARVIAESGQITTLTPVCPRCFLVPFVVDYGGQRFGKYPLGWPALLAIGEKLGARSVVNPLLAGFAAWLVFLLGRRLFNRGVGLLAQFLMVTSPFFLMNSGTLLSHPWSLLLTLGFILAWLDLVSDSSAAPRWVPILTAGLCLGSLVLTRPLTAVGVGLPFGLHGLWLMARGSPQMRLRVLGVGLAAGAVSSLYWLWQYAVTGDALLNPYLLWWPYDKVGFGPGVGVNPLGHSPLKAWVLTTFGLRIGSHDLFGWPYLSFLFLPFGLWAGHRKPAVWMVAGSSLALVAAYALYWTPAWLFGPRYYYESLPGAVILTAAGVFWLAGRLSSIETPPVNAGSPRLEKAQSRVSILPGRGEIEGIFPKMTFITRLRLWGVFLVLGLLVAGNMLFYLPQRLEMMKGLYNVSAADLAPFRSFEAGDMPPTLVIVHVEDNWIGYGRLLDLADPLFRSRFIFTVSQGPVEDQRVIQAFPERQVWDYYPERSMPEKNDDDKR
jgi:hypothetical protein